MVYKMCCLIEFSERGRCIFGLVVCFIDVILVVVGVIVVVLSVYLSLYLEINMKFLYDYDIGMVLIFFLIVGIVMFILGLLFFKVVFDFVFFDLRGRF